MSELALQLIKENKCTKDTFLDLGKCGLVNELPKTLFDCVWLEDLNLGRYFLDKKNKQIRTPNREEDNIFNEYNLIKLSKYPFEFSLCYFQIIST